AGRGAARGGRAVVGDLAGRPRPVPCGRGARLRPDASVPARPPGERALAEEDGRAARGRGRLLRQGHRPAARVGAAVIGRLGLGCAQLGNLYTAIDDETASATVAAAWDAGVR